MKSTIGANIVKIRKLNGISQKYLAEKIGMSSQGLLKIEKGAVSPKADTLKRISETLCVTPNQLFGIDEVNEDNSSILWRLMKENN